MGSIASSFSMVGVWFFSLVRGVFEQERPVQVHADEQIRQILARHGNNVLRLAYSYLHNQSDAEDVLQDVLLQYLKKQPDFVSLEHEKAWCLRVAMNVSKNKWKYNKIRKTDELYEELVSDQQDDLAYVWDAVKQLPDKYREVVHLYYQEGYTTAQIGSLLSMKEATVSSHLLRAREKLKLILKEAYNFGE